MCLCVEEYAAVQGACVENSMTVSGLCMCSCVEECAAVCRKDRWVCREDRWVCREDRWVGGEVPNRGQS